MNTTNLFVELVVIGVGAAVWVVLLLLSLFGYGWISFDTLLSFPALIPGLAIVYVLGIVIDRIADKIFERWATPLGSQWFKSAEEYRRARMLIYTRSDALRDLFEYSRSRLRICRGWALNSLFILLTLNLFVWSQMPPESLRWKISFFGTLFSLLFGIGAWRAWYQLVRNEYKRLHEQYTYLNAQKKKA